MTTKIEGQLEIDHERGVIYFHENHTGKTRLRICKLPSPIPKDDQLDVTASNAICSWGSRYMNLPPTHTGRFVTVRNTRFPADGPLQLLEDGPNTQVMGRETHRSEPKKQVDAL